MAFLGFKGTVARDFRPPFFFHQKYPPRILIHVQILFYLFGFRFVEFFELKVDSPLHGVGRFDPLLHLAVGSQILSDLTAATCSGEPNITAK